MVLVAYLDEFGHIGPYIKDSKKYNHHPLFGYGGFIIPVEGIRKFGSKFESLKERNFKTEIEASGSHPKRWEKKGNEFLSQGNWDKNGRQVRRHFVELSKYLKSLGGCFFFYGEAKPQGSEHHTRVSSKQRSGSILTSTMRELADYAESKDKRIMILLDQVSSADRDHAITSMASFMYSKDTPANTIRIVEVPMQIESVRYGAMQFADWYCALLSRVTENRFIENSNKFSWAPKLMKSVSLECGSAFDQSRIWLPARAKRVFLEQILRMEHIFISPVAPESGQRIGDNHRKLLSYKESLRK